MSDRTALARSRSLLRPQLIDRLQDALGSRGRIELRPRATCTSGNGVTDRVEHRHRQHQRRLAHRFGSINAVLAVLAQGIRLTLKVCGQSNAVGILYVDGACVMSLPALVPPQLFTGEPAHALHEAAFHLPHVDRGIQRAADIMQDVDAQQRDSPVSESMITSEIAAP